MRNSNVGQKSDKRYQIKVAQLKNFKDNLKSMSTKYANINWIGLIIHIVYQEVKFFDINNEWKTFKIPSEDYEKPVYLKFNTLMGA